MANTIELSISTTIKVIFNKDSQELEINSVEDLLNLDGLAIINHLEKLVIKNCYCLNDISILKNFNNLRYLEIDNCPNIKDLSSINNLEKLKRLKCIGFPDLNILSSLKENIKVKKLDLLQDEKWFTGFLFSDDIQLYIYFKAEKVSEIKPITNLQNCKEIGFHYCSELNSIEGIEVLKEIQEIGFFNCNQLKNISNLSKMSKLNRVSFEYCNSITDIDNLLSNIDFHELEVSNCENIKELRFPENSTIETLKLHSNSKLHKINKWSHLKKLKTLLIEDCNAIEDYEEIGKLSNLEELGLFYNEGEISLKTLTQLNQLKTLRIGSHNKKWE